MIQELVVGSDMYTEELMDHFQNPRNVGKMEEADGIGEIGNPVCGDVTTIYIKVRDDRIDEIKYQSFGCAAAIATGSMLTEMAKGKTLNEARSITKENVAHELGGLPEAKMHCSNLAAGGLHAAIEDYQGKRKR